MQRFLAADGPPPTADAIKAFRSDKLVALDRDKAEFCYQLCRASNARRIVEAGTSYGVSTLYLAAAVRDNIRAAGGSGVVIGTEYEPAKAAAARAHFEQAGLSRFIDLREGDLRETLQADRRAGGFHAGGHLDWDGAARAGTGRAAASARRDCRLRQYPRNIATNTLTISRFLHDPTNGFRTMTLPFDGGLELSVRCEPGTGTS